MTNSTSPSPHPTSEAPSTCPRCGQDRSDEPFYGICKACAGVLRATYDGSARSDVAAAEYEPKMNVTPNAVASKE